MSVPGSRGVRVWLGLGVSALFLGLLFAGVDRDELWESLRNVDGRWLLASLPVYAAALWLRAARWRRILWPELPLGARGTLAPMVIGYAANNVLPARAGEVLRALLIKRSHGTSRSAAIGTIVVERALDGLVLAVFLAATIALAGGSDALRLLAAAGLGAFVLVTALLVMLSQRPGWAGRLGAMLERLAGLLSPRLQPAARAIATGLLAGLTTLRGPRDWWAAVWLTAASWGLEAASYWLIGLAFGLGLPAPIYLAIAGAANLAIAAPSTAGGIGPFEFFAREVAVAFGVSTADATAYALGLHALILVSVVLAGAALAWRLGLGITAIARAPREDTRPGNGTGRPTAGRPDNGHHVT